MVKFSASQSVTRTEDNRLIVGKGRYTDDLKVDNAAFGYVLRSPVANAKITSIDTSEAEAAPGVIGVITGQELADAGLGPIPCVATFPNKDGSDMQIPPRPALAVDRVRYVGDGIALVVAETLNQAKDAVDLIVVDYDDLPAVSDTARALDKDAPLVWEDFGSNRVFEWEWGDEEATDEAFKKADHVTEIELVNQRVIVNSMETRACLGDYDKNEDKYTLYVGSQGVHMMRNLIAGMILQVDPAQLRVVTYDVGGGFGMKTFVYPEYPLVLYASKKVGRPVKWTGERSESFITDTHGRDNITKAELALNKDGQFLGLRIDTTAGLGAYLSQFGPFIPTLAAAGMHVGVYAIPTLYHHVDGVYTNTTPVDAYRGAGRPEAAYLIERLVDVAAREMGIEPDEIRRRNYVKPEQMPYTTPTGLNLDSGDFARNMEDGMKSADWSDFDKRRADAEKRGKLAGIGMAYYWEKTGSLPLELAHLEVSGNGHVTAIVGTQSNGQGHETAFAQLVSEKLGVPFEAVTVAMGDTDTLPDGSGTGGSRSLTMAGGAINLAGEDLIKKGKEIASNELEAAEADIVFEQGAFKVAGTDRQLGLFDVARIAGENAGQGEFEGITGDGTYEHETSTFPNGCHICEVEIDKDTGAVAVTRYSVVDDFGNVLNPMLVAGQVHGGIVQGLGQAMGEHAVYDNETGQLLTGSFMDYWMPRADDMPSFEFSYNEIPCQTNEMGVKGCGEAGTVGACPAFVNAVVDALEEYGVKHVDMPITPAKVWQIVNSAGQKAAAE